MLLTASSLALLVIYAGTKLLAQTKREALGNFYRYISFFLIIMGFLSLLGVGCYHAMMYHHRGEKMMEKKWSKMEKMHRKGNYSDGYGMDGKMGCEMSMHNCHKMMNGCNSGGMAMNGCCSGGNMMMHGGSCGGEMMAGCSEREGCKEKIRCECKKMPIEVDEKKEGAAASKELKK